MVFGRGRGGAAAGLGAALVGKATHASLHAADWALMMDVVDTVNQGWDEHGKSVVKAVRARIGAASAPHVQLLALELLSVLMKNCGAQLHLMVARKDVLQEMTRVAGGRATDPVVRERCLELIQEWGIAFAGVSGMMAAYATCYQSMVRNGFRFPPVAGTVGASGSAFAAQPTRVDGQAARASALGGPEQQVTEDDLAAIAVAQAELDAQVMGNGVDHHPAQVVHANGVQYAHVPGVGASSVIPVYAQVAALPPGHAQHMGQTQQYFDPSASHSIQVGPPVAVAQHEMHVHEQERARGRFQAAHVDTSTPEAVTKLKDELSVARNSVAVLADMLASIDEVRSPEGVLDDVVVELADQCEQMQPRVMNLVEGVEHDEIMCEALSLNDALQGVLTRHNELLHALQMSHRGGGGDAGAQQRPQPQARPQHQQPRAQAVANNGIVTQLAELSPSLQARRRQMHATATAGTAMATPAAAAPRAAPATVTAAHSQYPQARTSGGGGSRNGIGSRGVSHFQQGAPVLASIPRAPEPTPATTQQPTSLELPANSRQNGQAPAQSHVHRTAQVPQARVPPISTRSPSLAKNPFIAADSGRSAARKPSSPSAHGSGVGIGSGGGRGASASASASTTPAAMPTPMPVLSPPPRRSARAGAPAAAAAVIDPFADLATQFDGLGTQEAASNSGAPAPRRASAVDDILGL